VIKVYTNNRPREIIEGYELNKDQRKEFDYIDWSKVENGEETPQFFKYKGELYDLGEFSTTSELHDSKLTKWDGIQSDTFFSGILIKYTPDFEHVIVGRYYSS
jgi:hypothetical protein